MYEIYKIILYIFLLIAFLIINFEQTNLKNSILNKFFLIIFASKILISIYKSKLQKIKTINSIKLGTSFIEFDKIPLKNQDFPYFSSLFLIEK